MNKEQARKLEALVDNGYRVHIDCGAYLDGPVGCLFEEEGGPNKGKHVYSSEVFTDRLLDDVNVREVSVFAPAIDKWPEMLGTDDLDRWCDQQGIDNE